MRSLRAISFLQPTPINSRQYILGTRNMTSRSYKDAVEHLNSLQTNAAALEAIRASGGRSSAFAIPEMLQYLERIGYTPDDLNKLNVLHVTGTKGKGSTCAFVDSIIRCSMPQWKVGLYTSPHLVAVRERIRINGTPISEEEFSKLFFQVWDKFDQPESKASSTSSRPGYFRFMTLLAFHTFLTLKVDATILEVGVGGTYDSTNIVPKPIVTGVTALGLDHVLVLGKTLKEIAWQKGGIFKEGVPALTVNQPEEGMHALRQRAEEKNASEFIVAPLVPAISNIELGLSGLHQVQNATLAVQLSRTFLHSRSKFKSKELLPDAFVEGLVNAKWPGRCQTVSDPKYPKTLWYLDGAHTTESLDCCIQWFVSPAVGLKQHISTRVTRVLIFNCTNGRSGCSFLSSMHAKIEAQLKQYGLANDHELFFEHVIFCTNVTYADGGFKGDLTALAIQTSDFSQLKTQRELALVWSSLAPRFPTKNLHVLPSIEHAVNVLRKIGSTSAAVQVLVTGSLHLVGGIIEVAGLTEVAL